MSFLASPGTINRQEIARYKNIPIETLGFAPGYVDYQEALSLQEQTAAAVKAGEGYGSFFLLEHPAVYTAGRRSDPAEYPTDGTPVVPVNRGGKVTWHGPGQLIGYPVVQLKRPTKLVPFVRSLEQALIDTIAELGVRGERVDGRTGVWVDTGLPYLEKVAQIGIHASRGVITHGFSLNCSCDLAEFEKFVPCGITDASVTTLSKLTGSEITPEGMVSMVTPHLLELLADEAKAEPLEPAAESDPA